MRLKLYVVATMASTAMVLLRAFSERPNFYSAAVYLGQSNECILVLANFALFLAGALSINLQRLVFGELRVLEAEQVRERAWFNIIETLFAMTMFRDEIGPWSIFLLVSSLNAKVWLWITDKRIEQLDQQPPRNPRLFHTRLCAALGITASFSYYMTRTVIMMVLDEARPSMMLMFSLEFIILLFSAVFSALKYMVFIVDGNITAAQTVKMVKAKKAQVRAQRERIARENENGSDAAVNAALAGVPREEDVDENDVDVPGWEKKGQCLFIVDIISDFVKLLLFSAYFIILVLFSVTPIHLLRDLYLTFRAFAGRVRSYFRYIEATRDMQRRYPDATPEDLATESTCIICRSDMYCGGIETQGLGANGEVDEATMRALGERQKPKKLPCGHILHFGCLRSWLERQQVCPTCRSSVVPRADANHGRRHRHRHARDRGAGGAGAHDRRDGGADNDENDRGGGGGGEGNRPGPGVRRRTFQLGPIQIVFERQNLAGAGGGDQQLPHAFPHPDGPIAPTLAAAAARMNAANAGGANAGAEGAGGGLGALGLGGGDLGGGPVAGTSIERQIQQLQDRIMTEMARLGIAQEQLDRLSRQWQEVRATRAGAAGGNVPGAGNENWIAGIRARADRVRAQLQQGLEPNQNLRDWHNYSRERRRDQQRQQQQPLVPGQAMGPGDPRLPEGVALPEGWRLTPMYTRGERPSWFSPPGTQQPAMPDSAATSVGGDRQQHQANPQPTFPQPGFPPTAAAAARGASSVPASRTYSPVRPGGGSGALFQPQPQPTAAPGANNASSTADLLAQLQPPPPPPPPQQQQQPTQQQSAVDGQHHHQLQPNASPLAQGAPPQPPPRSPTHRLAEMRDRLATVQAQAAAARRGRESRREELERERARLRDMEVPQWWLGQGQGQGQGQGDDGDGDGDGGAAAVAEAVRLVDEAAGRVHGGEDGEARMAGEANEDVREGNGRLVEGAVGGEEEARRKAGEAAARRVAGAEEGAPGGVARPRGATVEDASEEGE
ncbi:hypothetical protein BDY21DRAFT_420104 [Lineolata rhizophorae]|uniref:RING-type E3 ubiquitin transferase n=1 Tax=Lineolata rhizophorae TaxID=578093 RepID=A0A6A6P6I5_9PEZI|nr:hypothetical protein BDY21DRAFT_420104 [Lineolata rhizophorae]